MLANCSCKPVVALNDVRTDMGRGRVLSSGLPTGTLTFLLVKMLAPWQRKCFSTSKHHFARCSSALKGESCFQLSRQVSTPVQHCSEIQSAQQGPAQLHGIWQCYQLVCWYETLAWANVRSTPSCRLNRIMSAELSAC